MNLTQTCPDRDTLSSHLLGKTRSHQADWLDEHVEGCLNCQQVIKRLDPQDDLLDDLANGPSTVAGDSNQIARIIRRGKQLQSQFETDDADQTTRVLAEDDDAPHVGVAPSAEDIDFLHPPQAPDEIGRLGGYRVLEVLGVGGMGVIFRAEDPRLQRSVAIKVMKPAVAASRSAKNRFLREAKATAGIEHDHIVSIYQVGEDRSIPFIAMRYLRGQSLQAAANQAEAFPASEIARIGRQIAEGLAAAHARGLVHRDIKPDNIWIEEATGRVKILDFGLARIQKEDAGLTQTGMVVGTPRYMAPEQMRGEAVDHRCDLFSLGGVLYQLATGVAPFAGGSLTATLLAVAEVDYRPLSENSPELHPELTALITRLLSKDPSDRPKAAAEVATTLANVERKLEAEQAERDRQRRLAETVVIERPVDPEAARKSHLQTSGLPVRIGVALFAVVLAAAGAFWASGVFFQVETERGTLVVKVSGDAFATSVQGKQVQIRNTDTGSQYTIDLDSAEASKTLDAGPYKFVITSDTGFRTRSDRFEIASGQQKQVEVWWERKPVAAQSTNQPRESGKTREVIRGLGNADSLGEYVLLFDGNDDYVTVPDIKLTSSESLTIECFVTPLSAPTSTRMIVESGNFLSLYSNADRYGSLLVCNDRTTATRTSTLEPSVGVRRHLAAVFDEVNLHLFVDGERQKSDLAFWTGEKYVTVTPPIRAISENSLQRLIIGSNGNDFPNPRFFHGVIDELRVSMEALYENDFEPPTRFKSDDDTLVMYHFDEGQGKVLIDRSGNERHGSIHGAHWLPSRPADTADTIEPISRARTTPR